MKTWLQQVFGIGEPVPYPVIGQVWRSGHSGRYMRVSDVHKTDCGSLFISVEHYNDKPTFSPLPWGIGDHYCIGLGGWRRKLREERRTLVSTNGEIPHDQP